MITKTKGILAVVGLTVGLSGCYMTQTEDIKNHGADYKISDAAAREAVKTYLGNLSSPSRNMTMGPVRVGNIGETFLPLKTNFICVKYERLFNPAWIKKSDWEWVKTWEMMPLQNSERHGRVIVYAQKTRTERAYVENCKGQSHG